MPTSPHWTFLDVPPPTSPLALGALGPIVEHQGLALLAAWVTLALAWFFASLKLSMGQALAVRVLERAHSERRRRRLEPLLKKLAALAESASMFESAFAILFALVVFVLLGEAGELGWKALLGALVVSVPALYLTTRGLAQAVALRFGDVLVERCLPSFYVLQLPLSGLVFLFRALRRGMMRAVGLRDDDEQKREIVAGLSQVLAGAEISGKLDETEREIIGNVMEFRDVDVAAIMTPRTEIRAVEIGAGVLDAARVAAETGHSRIPVYETSLDSIVGTVAAHELLGLLTREGGPASGLRPILHPAYVVPETKRVSDLLAELRREKIKLAIVIDEYGGTAGLVTIGDIVTELVGDIPDERDRGAVSPVRVLPGGVAEVEASTHVSEVNKALALEIPETADYETLGGFVLAQLGRFPARGEGFVSAGTEYSVVDASDRRVYKVRVRKLEGAGV